MRGTFVTFEGMEGVGKSTQIARAADHLRGRGIEPLVTREPGGTALAEKLRALVLEPGQGVVSPTAELLIMFAARASHVAEVIRPAVAEGRVVLCDRFTDATEAYQGGGRGMSHAWIRELARIAHPRLAPDLTILLDAPPELALSRLQGRGPARDRIEGEGAAFFERVREAYLAIAQREPARVRVVDATRGADVVAGDVAALLDERLPRGRR
ncbi:MAG TPA: dTMP kinase [Steroidobacteraceae bacterium]|jgi:dTMP kinase|nr:dTMP kinase [Steroidobacteraceae bacterium]